MQHHSKRRQCAYFFGKLREEAGNSFFVNGFPGSVALKRVNDLLTIGIVTATLLGTLPEEVRAVSRWCRGALGSRRHLELWLGASESSAGFRRPLSLRTTAVAVVKLIATTAAFKPITAARSGSLVTASGIWT